MNVLSALTTLAALTTLHLSSGSQIYQEEVTESATLSVETVDVDLITTDGKMHAADLAPVARYELSRNPRAAVVRIWTGQDELTLEAWMITITAAESEVQADRDLALYGCNEQQ